MNRSHPGLKKHVLKAKQLVERMLTTTVTRELGSLASLVVGPDGATAQAISDSSGAELWVSDSGLLTITGSEAAVALALKQVADVTASVNGASKGRAFPATQAKSTPPQAQAAPAQAAAPVPAPAAKASPAPASSPAAASASASALAPTPTPAPVQAASSPAAARPVQVAPVHKADKPKVRWLWQGDQGEWTQYPREHEKELERNYSQLVHNEAATILHFTADRFSYRVKRTRRGHLVQINQQTRTERAVKRKGMETNWCDPIALGS